MNIKNLLLAFQGLDIQARALQIIRFFLGFISLIFLLACLLGPKASLKFYFVRINCSHLDVSQGIYESLRNSVSESNGKLDDGVRGLASHLPIDNSLTNSEITILSEYAEEKVENAPQYFMGSMWDFCVGYYSVSPYIGSEGELEYARYDAHQECNKQTDQRSLFDYRAAMQKYQMDGVLAYGLQTSEFTDRKYNERVDLQVHRYRVVPITLILSCVATIACMLFEFVLYSNRNGALDVMALPLFLLHAMVVVSILPFLLSAIAACTITALVRQLRSEIQQNFGSFGIKLQLGTVFFTCIWFAFSTAVFTMLSWIIPVWCANPPEEDEFNQNYTYSRSGDIGKRSASRPQISSVNLTRNPSSSSDPRDKLLYASEDEGNEYDIDYDYDDNEVRTSLNSTSNPTSNSHSHSGSLSEKDRDVFYNYREERENDRLRRLGESLSRNVSVRHLNKKMHKNSNTKLDPVKESGLSAEETKNMIYNDSQYSPLPHHYRVETFDGFSRNPFTNNEKDS